ncbi:hypothetical protein [Ottowia sp.]|uniref:hypothetical protein n=1 Tax=Ottowia sp. TaxID=1898956 RepID=UPI003A8AC513
MEKEDARYQTLEQLHERRKQVVRLHNKVIKVMQIAFGKSELQELNTALAEISIQGERLPPAVQVFSDVEAPPKTWR